MLLGARLNLFIKSSMAEAVRELRVKVCVIGCGVSGAAAAGELVAAGLSDVVVLEAAGRPGGRVHTISLGDSHLEMGANWLHGQTGNCVYEWAQQHCPECLMSDPDPCTEDKDKSVFVDPHGRVLPDAVTAEIQDSIAGIEEADMAAFGGSLGAYFQQQFSSRNKWGAAGWQLLDWYGRLQCNIDGAASWHQVSAATRSQYWELPGPAGGNWKRRGYQAVMDHLLERVGRERVLLNCPALSVRWGDLTAVPCVDQLALSLQGLATAGEETPAMNAPVVTKTGEGGPTPPVGVGGPCRITTPEKVVVADHVICSASLGVLKATASHLFSPPLPPRKMLAIQKLGFDAVAKVFLQFERPWWSPQCTGFNFLNDLSCPPPDPVQEWEEHFLGFYPVVQQECVLLGWLSGAPAQAMELTDLPDVIARSYAVLQRRLAPLCQVSKPVWGTRSTWTSNPSIRGAYSYRSVEADESDVWASDLAEPVTVAGAPVLQFCGEATHGHLYSTVAGAWETGVREARRLLLYLREGVLPPLPRVASLTDAADVFPAQLMAADDLETDEQLMAADNQLIPAGNLLTVGELTGLLVTDEQQLPAADSHQLPADAPPGLVGLQYLLATDAFRLPAGAVGVP